MAIVIIGAGHAGVEAADALRRQGYDGELTIVDGATHEPYQRPPLSKDYVDPGADASPLPMRAAKFWADQRVRLLLGSPVERVDRAARIVRLADGTELGYDDLVLATGAHGRPAPCAGAELDGVLILRTLDDAIRVRSMLADARRVVVVGAGFIGLEFASAAEKRGLAVTVLELAERPMQRVLSPVMSEHYRARHQAAGARLVFGEGLAGLEGTDGRVSAVIGSSGARYEADLVVLGLGITPADELGREMGLRIDNGIAVDEQLRTSDPHVYAIGDVASYPSGYAGCRVRLEAVQNATDQARALARTLTGTAEAYTAVPWFWTVQCGTKLQIAGLAVPEMETVTTGELDAGKGSVLGFVDGRLVCVESVGAPGDHLAARKLIAAGGGGVTPEQAREPGFTLKAAAKTLA
ncbi:pyridine nucleotide-disulfide oxidoreductase [Enemella evansiae]|uniref:Pyridine nucleotide-disulfide oxidoreductase n=1 Tax=Enemella evansiae TaxID=2016499 RepID=A0A255GNN5_9ACTN|nr:FAD-dependent oxidoreductase [Enemella evansiae]OYO17427.1 pyridine nucleotide-disulfide oxidoreductase [Enemella evansiae]